MSEQATAEEQPRRRSWRPTLGQVAAIVGVVGGIVSLVFVFKPDWRPLASPDATKLTIDDSKVSTRPATFRAYYQRLGLPLLDLDPKLAGRRGVLVEFPFEAIGLRGKTLPVHRELVDATTAEVVPDPQSGSMRYSDDAVAIVPSTNDDARTWFVWSPVPETTGRYQVRVTIYQPRRGESDVPLDGFTSPEFGGLKSG